MGTRTGSIETLLFEYILHLHLLVFSEQPLGVYLSHQQHKMRPDAGHQAGL